MKLADKIKNITDRNNQKEQIEFNRTNEGVINSEYRNLLTEVQKASDEGAYFATYNPDIIYDAYYMLYEKLEKDGFKYEYTGGGTITIWWDDTDGKQYISHLY